MRSKNKKTNKNTMKNILIWIVIALLIQNGIFFFFNQKFGANVTIKAVKVDENANKKETEKIKLDSNVKDVKFSFNGQYMSYMENDKLKIHDIKKNKKIDIETEKGAKIDFCKWLSKESSLILVEKNNNQFRFYSYDARKNVKRELLDFDMKKFFIEVKGEHDKIEDIVSSDTNVMYIKVCRGFAVYDVYKSNIMNQLTQVKKSAPLKGKIAIPNNDTSLVYKDFDNVKIKKENDKILKFSNSKNLEIVGIDKENNLYLQELDGNGEVINILSGSIAGDPSSYKTTKLPKPAQKSEIILEINGKLYFNNLLEGKLLDLKSNVETQYDGKFLGVYKDGVATVVNNEIKFKTLN